MKHFQHVFRNAAVRRAARFTRAAPDPNEDAILIFQPDHLGDILLSQPAVRAIRRTFPGSLLIGVVGPWSETIARLAWPVDELITIEFPAYNRSSPSRNPLGPYIALRSAASILKNAGAGQAYVLRPDDWWSAWLASMATAGPIVTARDPKMDPFATVQVDMSEYRHAIQRSFAIGTARAAEAEQPPNVRSEPVILDANDSGSELARAVLLEHGILNDYLVMHPGSGADVKLWPVARWRALAARLAAQGHTIVVTGSLAESRMAEQVADGVDGAISLAGKTSLPTLIEVLRAARLVAGPDCGPLHLAVACQTRTIHLFGPSDPGKFGPWGPPENHRVLSAGWSCKRCGDLSMSRPVGCGCMLAISVDRVFDEIQEMIGQHAAR